jgi:N-acetylmuramic acid 6-phosphate (MurNAc-6-P) etherase
VQLTGRSNDDARAALALADGNLKLAVLLLHGCELGAAREILARSGGQLRAALALLGKPAPDMTDLRYSGRVTAPAMGGGGK